MKNCENIWICFQFQLYQIPGFTLPMCLKCSEQFTSKGITINSLNFYQNLQQPVTATITTTQVNNTTAPATGQLNASSTNQPTNLSRATDMNTDSNQSSTSSHDQPINIKQEAIGLAEELEKSLQNGDVRDSYNQCYRNFFYVFVILSEWTTRRGRDLWFVCEDILKKIIPFVPYAESFDRSEVHLLILSEGIHSSRQSTQPWTNSPKWKVHDSWWCEFSKKLIFFFNFEGHTFVMSAGKRSLKWRIWTITHDCIPAR